MTVIVCAEKVDHKPLVNGRTGVPQPQTLKNAGVGLVKACLNRGVEMARHVVERNELHVLVDKALAHADRLTRRVLLSRIRDPCAFQQHGTAQLGR